ncbi:MAG: class I SAM-dependent methyltransferase [Phycisphaerales bacterium]
MAVQCPEAEVDFIDRVCRSVAGRPAALVREDFCGTFHLCGEWVRRRRTNRAIGVDLDPKVLAWGRRRAEQRLDAEQRSRIELRRANVLSVRTPPVDALLAFNFSYFIFKTRTELLGYFRKSFAAIRPGGLFFLDAYGGSDSFREMEEERALDGFVYVWDQNKYNPITGEVTNYIHFRFPDGSELKRAFAYDWRLWTLPEIAEALEEAGFRDVTVYWEGTDAKGAGNGIFRPSRRGEACEGWVAYIVARRPTER